MPAHRKDSLADEMHALYEQGFSIAKVALAHGVSRQAVHKMFARRALKLRTIQPLAHTEWGGFKYSLREHGYYAKTTGTRSYLHRDVWESVHGPIPDGYEVHHRDEDKSNNRIDNLELLTRAEHGARHGFGGNQTVPSIGRRPVKVY